MKTALLVAKAVLSPWLLLAGLAFFRALGFAVTAKNLVALACFCLFWSVVISVYLGVLHFLKRREERRRVES
ncbi:hypothetical protein [Ralstonia pseudosolanacearum]|uniref:hypothetical protein n=1 Tax=Ralstonia pseudosolanacearum TaxID=1310165 RepID=UPI001FF9B53E|nr:hypothetical protein [Ralstonia pseudosolanacearum]